MSQIDLYKFVLGSQEWNMTGVDVDQIYNDELYSSETIERTEVEQKNELSKASVTISLPIDHELSVLILSSFFQQILSLTIFTNADGMVTVTWKGRFSSFQPEQSKIKLVFESIFTSMRRPGLRATFQKSCRFALYGRGCGLDPEDFDVAGTLSDIDGEVLTIAEADTYDDGYFRGGMLAAGDGSLSYIIDHVGPLITIQRVSFSLNAEFVLTGPTTPVKLYPGCDHSRETCNSKFNNLLNYGGFDWIPSKNPMGGSSVI